MIYKYLELSMKLYKFLLSAFIAGIFFACGTEEEPAPAEEPKNEFVQIVKEIINEYDSVLVDRQIIDYTYEKPDDYFWVKAEYKDTLGKIFKTISRKLDEKSRMPVSEEVKDELGLTENYELKYCPECYELISKIEFVEGVKVSETKWAYDDGYLMSIETINFSKDSSYKNVDGNNITSMFKQRPIVAKVNRLKGNHDFGFVTEMHKVYYTERLHKRLNIEGLNIGAVYFESKTGFDKAGYPFNLKIYNARQPEGESCEPTDKEYYKIDTTGLIGKLTSIEGYNDKEFTIASVQNTRKEYEYDEKGILNAIKEYKYNDSTKAYDLMHDIQAAEWKAPDFNAKYDAVVAAKKNENICYHRGKHSFMETKVDKYADGEIIISEYSGEWDKGQAPADPELKKIKQTSIDYRKVAVKKVKKNIEE